MTSERIPIELGELERPSDVRMTDARGEARFVVEHLAKVAVLRKVRRQHLEREDGAGAAMTSGPYARAIPPEPTGAMSSYVPPTTRPA